MVNAKEFVFVHTTYQGGALSIDIQSSLTLEPSEVSELFWFQIREKLSEHFNTHVEKSIKVLNVENIIQEADYIVELDYSYDEKAIDYPSEESDLDFCKDVTVKVLDEKLYQVFEDIADENDFPTVDDYNFTPDVG